MLLVDDDGNATDRYFVCFSETTRESAVSRHDGSRGCRVGNGVCDNNEIDAKEGGIYYGWVTSSLHARVNRHRK
jgi:hypothetical protein